MKRVDNAFSPFAFKVHHVGRAFFSSVP